MSKIICDSFDGPDTSANTRFVNGYKAQYIETSNIELSKSTYYSVESKLCLAFTKSTSNNIFYVAPAVDVKFLSRWIDEIAPHFPSLKIKLVTILKEEYKISTESNSIATNIPFLEVYEGTNEKVFMRLAISKKSRCYSITNMDHAPFGKFTRLGFLVNMFMRYCISKKSIIGCKEDLNNLVSNFCLEKLEDVVTIFSGCNNLEVSLDTINPAYNGSFIVESDKTVDTNSINYKVVHQYLTDIVAINYDLFTNYLRTGGSDLNYDTVLIRALFSKKAYPLESYLANHLIRAGIAPDQRSFIEQYFLIKEALPDEHFWSRILITQFGFRFYGYYWLTHLRTFRPFTESAFLSAAENAGSDSSHELFKQFAISLNSRKLTMLVNSYTNGRFKEFLLGGEIPISVALKESKKDKFINLRICDKYEVFNEDETSYYIKGDNFNIKKYLKTNFVKV